MRTLEVIRHRRSISRLCEPAPEGADLRHILEAAVAAPDHGRLRPWRLVILVGEAKEAFGAVLADALVRRCRAANTEPHPDVVSRERTKLNRAPLVVVVAAVRRESRTVPWEEQYASAAAAAQNMLLAATALGYGSMWRTGEAAYDPQVKAALSLTSEDAIVGFLYLGTATNGSSGRPPDRNLAGVVEHWRPTQR